MEEKINMTETTVSVKRERSVQQKESAKLRRQQTRFEKQENPEEDRDFKDKHNSYYANQSEEKKIQNKVKRKMNQPGNLDEIKAQVYASRSGEQIEQYKISREEAIQRYTEEERYKIKQVIF